MTDDNRAAPAGRDWSATLFLPRTDFPMRGDPARTEPGLLGRWRATDLLGRVRAGTTGLPRFVVHDGPPYANGDLHFGHALNKTLKDAVARSRRMSGWASDLVPGWDCHGLPVESGVEQAYRARGVDKADVPVTEFRGACRAHAARWLDVQREGFRRLGVLADWDAPYVTMDYAAEARVAGEAMRMAAAGHLYRGRRPVLWSVAEGTALAEAEVEHRERVDPAVHVAFRAVGGPLDGTLFPAWTTTPWTLPANRAVAFSSALPYGLYRAGAGVMAVADARADDLARALGAGGMDRVRDLSPGEMAWARLAHPLSGSVPGYGEVPLVPSGHVTGGAGTGFVHLAPGHGREDFDAWQALGPELEARGWDPSVPDTLNPDGTLTGACHGFAGRRVLTPHGGRGDAEDAVMEALSRAGTLLARSEVRHEYPHSWRSKKPLLYRTTPQWFAALDRPLPSRGGRTLRDLARDGGSATEWLPARSRNRMSGMLEARPDWVLSRQRSWGVPLTLFTHATTGETLRDDAVDARVVAAFEAEGADAWFAPGAAARFLGADRDPSEWVAATDVLDVWFDSGATQAFVLDDPARFPTVSGLRRPADDGPDRVMYLEGSDQHRGWFQSSLLVGAARTGRAPYDVVMTHGFVLDGTRTKMSKSGGNAASPASVTESAGADALRLWALSADPSNDVVLSPDALKGASDLLRKWRNTLRWLLGNLAHRSDDAPPDAATAPPLERLLLHRLAEVGSEVADAYAAFDFRRVVATLSAFMASDLSAFHFEARKDVLYCDPTSSPTRRAALSALDATLERLLAWMAPLVPFTAEEAWLRRHPSSDGSVHLLRFPDTPDGWLDPGLAARWEGLRDARRTVLSALEAERAAKRLRSNLDARPEVHVADPGLLADLAALGLAETCVTSGVDLVAGPGPAGAFRLEGVPGVAVVPRASGDPRCERSWRRSPDVGSDPRYPGLSARDAAAVAELDGDDTGDLG